MRGLFIVIGLLTLAAQPGAAALVEPVRIDTGMLSGLPGRDAAITVFRGVPYAAPPVGNLRWRAPAPALSWEGIRKADSFGAICPQTPRPGLAMSEDCLTLNIWTGAASRSEKRPVFVWLHVFLNDYGSNPQFDGEGLARKGVIVVTLNYRIGPLGFLAMPELSRESGHGASGNYGVMDQIAALQWVRRNIQAFGGDPTQVTIAGMSSQRGSSVAYLAVAPQAKGLFARGISQSQFPIPSVLEARPAPAANSLTSAEAAGVQYRQGRGVRTLAELRALPWEKLMEQGGAGAARPVFQPIVDGWVVPISYNDAAAGVAHADATYVAGNNLNEGGAPTAAAVSRLRAQQGPDPRGRAEPKLTLAAYLAWATEKFGQQADEFLKLYPAANDDDAAWQNNAVVGDYARVSTYLWSERWARSSSKPIFTYFWTHAPPSRGAGGAGHGSEIGYVFNNLYVSDLPWTEQDKNIAEVMSSYWANIAKKGDPNGEGLPRWPAFDPASGTVMELGDRFAPMPVTSAEKLEFWRRFQRARQTH